MSQTAHRAARPAALALPLALALALAACGGEPDAAQPQAMPVTVVTLESAPVTLTRELPGHTRPSLVAEVRPQVTGIIERQLFTEGSHVKAGQPLYQLEDATYRADAASARAALASAEATLVSARLAAARASELVKIDAVSEQDAENATAALRQAEASVGVARAALQRANVTVGYAGIDAPISGRIGKSAVTRGALVTANQATALATVQQLDPIYVDVTQSASELLALRKAIASGEMESAGELPVTILLEDGSAYDHPGKLAFSEVTVDPSTGSYALRVVVDNPDHLLLPGMYVRAVVGSGVRENAVLVPQQGIARDPKGNTSAMVVNAEGKVEVRPVKVSRAIGNQWLVESGLAAGDKVIVEGLQKIQPGMPVQAAEAQPEAATAPGAAAPGNAGDPTAPGEATGAAAESAGQ